MSGIRKTEDHIGPYIQALPEITTTFGRNWVMIVGKRIMRESQSDAYWIHARYEPSGKYGGYHPNVAAEPFRLRSFSPSQALRRAMGWWNMHPTLALGWTSVASFPGEKRPTMKVRASSPRIKGPANTDVYYSYLASRGDRKYYILARAIEYVEEHSAGQFGEFVARGIAPKFAYSGT